MTTITCVVDDLAKKGTQLKTQHGLAFWIETGGGTILFDTGQTEEVLTHNMSKLGIDEKDIDAVAISHGHYDHVGGLKAILVKNPNLPVYANEGVFTPKFILKEGKFTSKGFESDRAEFAELAGWRLSSEPQAILPDLWTTGEIIGREEPEGRSVNHYIMENDEFVPDPYRDDMSLVLKIADGLVLICGCCHAGLINTLNHVSSHFNGPIIGVMGGTHLITADGAQLTHVVGVLGLEYPNLRYYLNHCTGGTAIEALRDKFGARVLRFGAGETVSF